MTMSGIENWNSSMCFLSFSKYKRRVSIAKKELVLEFSILNLTENTGQILQILCKIKNGKLKDKFLFSLDVVSLYPSVNTDADDAMPQPPRL